MQILSIRTIQEHHYKRPTWKSYLRFRLWMCVFYPNQVFSNPTKYVSDGPGATLIQTFQADFPYFLGKTQSFFFKN